MNKEKFRELRLEKGFTLTEMGYELGVSMRTICNWEAGLHVIPKPVQKLIYEKWGKVNGEGAAAPSCEDL